MDLDEGVDDQWVVHPATALAQDAERFVVREPRPVGAIRRQRVVTIDDGRMDVYGVSGIMLLVLLVLLTLDSDDDDDDDVEFDSIAVTVEVVLAFSEVKMATCADWALRTT